MLGNGLRAYEAGAYGGWGGRQESQRQPDVFSSPAGDTSQQAMVARISARADRLKNRASDYPDFFPAAQRDFAARLQWSVTPKYSGANHAPVVKIEGPLNIVASPGQTIRLNGAVSDADKDVVSVHWFQLQVGTYPGKISIMNVNSAQAKALIPKDAVSGQTIHVILEATDNGSPALTSYQRIIITVK